MIWRTRLHLLWLLSGLVAGAVGLLILVLLLRPQGLFGKPEIDGTRRLTFDNTVLFWLYTAGQGAAGIVLLHGFPRLL